MRTTPLLAGQTSDIREDVVGGLLSALLYALFGDAIAGLVQRLEALFAAWRAGTLPPLPTPSAPQFHSRKTSTSRRHSARARHRRPASLRARNLSAPTAKRHPAWPPVIPAMPRATAVLSVRAEHARCTTSAPNRVRIGSP